MAMNQIPGHNIYVGGIFALSNKQALKRANITHIVSALRFGGNQELLKSYESHLVEVDDVDYENILEHFPSAIRFIQSGLDAGGSVLVHCAMGKSRSATICIAYLLHQQRRNLTPQAALALIREGRPLCEPNDGFMSQLELYYEMGCPDEVDDHPLYQRWLYRRDVEDSVACGRAPELSSVRFEDETSTPAQISDSDGSSVEIKCRKCRRELAKTPSIISHEKEKHENAKAKVYTECAHIFLHPMRWMTSSLFPQGEGDAPLSGRLICPNPSCGANVGKFAWQGLQCNCNHWVVPALGLAKAKVDITKKRSSNLPPTSVGIRMPPGMRPAEGSNNGRGNL
ncbi:hypothetical protein N7468_003134 [Penicillium chermesinum]|uniref:protein-tyrosine-phosphatase n=1 Tax=Penicillium chermesinum TaxID=63820 RepID=A0A9W9P6G5_9EURO|nr:uncharacterized protein N7468_003134 [Penicillium chermesinum]KAJ5238515.1 hypothetical protein N7468_003134 [Penicillium chermesinum]KAJ6164168.1 hypothetical protein N7470_002840 [Penicillium chermesinum]